MKITSSKRGIWILAFVAIMLSAWTTTHETLRWRKAPFADFNNIKTGAECLIAACDPYDFIALNHEASRRHEIKPEIWPMTPVYPPSALILLLPFEGLGWPTAAIAFNVCAGLATAIACALLVCSLRLRLWDPAALPLLATLLSIPIVATLEFANPALLVAGILAIACVLLLKAPSQTKAGSALGWILLGVAVALKPQLALGAVAILLWRRATRPAALRACALAILLLLAGAAAYRLRLGSFRFLGSLHYALWLSSMPTASSDFANRESFDFLNIQTTFALIPGITRPVINGLAWFTTAALAATAMFLEWKTSAVSKRPWTCIALATAISMLPVYHRGYDRVIALLLLPAAAEIAATNKRLAWLYAAILTFWVANDTIMSHILRRWRFMPQNPVEDVAFCLVLLTSLWQLAEPLRETSLPVEV